GRGFQRQPSVLESPSSQSPRVPQPRLRRRPPPQTCPVSLTVARRLETRATRPRILRRPRRRPTRKFPPTLKGPVSRTIPVHPQGRWRAGARQGRRSGAESAVRVTAEPPPACTPRAVHRERLSPALSVTG